MLVEEKYNDNEYDDLDLLKLISLRMNMLVEEERCGRCT